MNRSPDDDRLPADPWLREALRHAPGSDVPVPAAVRSAILDEARRAAAPVKAQRHRTWRDALLRMITPTRMGWAGAVTAGVVVLVVGLQRESAPLEASVAELTAGVPAQVPAVAADPALAALSRRGLDTAKIAADAAGAVGTTLAQATPMPNANVADRAEAPAPPAPRAGSAQAPSRAAAIALAADPSRAAEPLQAKSATPSSASVAPDRPDALPQVAAVANATEARASSPLSVAAAPAAPMPTAAGVQVLAQAPAAPPAAAAEAASDGARLAARASTFARTSPPAAAAAGSQPQPASTLAVAGSPRSAAAGLVPARTVSEDRLGELLQWTVGRAGLRWSAAGAEGPWGPAQEAWLRALRAAASGRWGESPALAGVAGTVVLQAPGEPAVRVTVGDAPWAVWVQVEDGIPQAARLDSRARARIETLRQGW